MAIHIRRWEFIGAHRIIGVPGGTAVALTLAARAQQPTIRVIGFMSVASGGGYAGILSAFSRGWPKPDATWRSAGG